MSRPTTADIPRLLRQLAEAFESVGASDPCESELDREPTDHTSTAIDGESTSSLDAEQIGRRHMRRLIRGLTAYQCCGVYVCPRKECRSDHDREQEMR